MGDGRSTERFLGSDGTDFGYGDVSPSLGQEAYERAQSYGQPGTDWRGGYGGVAPAFGTPGDQGGAADPNAGNTG
ncbi:MAG TPA: hypothetical protein V6D08_05460, partial [Candidatus Obscuribacterales bacterium]